MNNISKLEFISELSAISKQCNTQHGICLFLGLEPMFLVEVCLFQS